LDSSPWETVHPWEAVHRPPHGPEPWDELATLPVSYGEDRVTLLVRDPRCVFAFWEVTDGGWRDAAGVLPPGPAEAELVLRVYDLTDVLRPGAGPAPPWQQPPLPKSGPAGSGRWFDYAVGSADRWYVHLPEPGRSVAAEIGARRGAAFVPIARSNVVHTPPGAPVTWEFELGWSSAALYGWCTSPAGAANPAGPLPAASPKPF